MWLRRGPGAPKALLAEGSLGGPISGNVAKKSASGHGGIGYGRRGIFYLGLLAVTAGVLLHLPMYVQASSQHYMLAGMSADPWMLLGMLLTLVGLAATVYGLVPRPRALARGPIARVRVQPSTTLGSARPTWLSFSPWPWPSRST